MTETDASVRPLTMPEKYIPYLQEFRLYKLLKDMAEDIIINLPKDHLKHMKIFLCRRSRLNKDIDRIMLLVSPELKIDVKAIVKDLIKALGYSVITRRYVMDCYEMDDNYVPGCISPVTMSAITKQMTSKEHVVRSGWLMFDHPCTVREARCLQQDGVFPTVTLVLTPPRGQTTPSESPLTPSRTFFQQDFEGLKFAYKATLKYVEVDMDADVDQISAKCINAIRACTAGLQNSAIGHHVVGAPGVYRVILIGPRGSGCRSQAQALSNHFGLVYLNFNDIYNEAKEKSDEIGLKLRSFGLSINLKAEIVKRRIQKKDCINLGWVLTGYPTNGAEFEHLDKMTTPANRVIFLAVDAAACKNRLMSQMVDWCTGQTVTRGSGPRLLPHPKDDEAQIDAELDYYFSEAMDELRAAAGITAVEIDAKRTYEEVQVKIQAAVIAAPAFDFPSIKRRVV